MFDGFFDGKRVVITGVAGVKGTWLAQQLLELGSQVIGIDKRDPAPDSNFVASALHDRIRFVRGDITDLSLMQKTLANADCIFHLAAISIVGEARQNPLATYHSNTLGTATVLEAMRLNDSVRWGVFVTTDKVYRPKGGEAWIESDPLFATEPYPVSKACAEQIITDYYCNYLKHAGQRIAIARAGNVLLGGDPYSSRRMNGAGHLHVDCFEALIDHQSPALYTPKFTRPYTYGLDILCGYLTLMSRLDDEGVCGEAFNFGPHERLGIENGLLASKICQVWGTDLTWHSTKPREEPFDKQAVNWDKARSRLGWQPAYTIYEALHDIAQWYRAWVETDPACPCGSMVATNRMLIYAHQQAAHNMGIGWAQEA